MDRAAPPPPPRARRAHGRRPRGSLLRLAALLRAAGRAGPARARLRGHPLGRRRAASRSSSTSSTGAATIPIFVAHARATRGRRPPSRASPARPAARRRSRSSRSTTTRWTSSSSGSSPGCPDDVRSRLRDAADGIPLYAVETVRMLRDRGVLERDGDERARHGGPRRRSRCRRRCTRSSPRASTRSRTTSDGCSRTQPSSARRSPRAVSRHSRASRRTRSSASSRASCGKELLAVETDPFSPERGQLGFLQALVQRVTYETIARRDRRARHLAAARFLATDAGIDPDEIAEVIATHYLDAHEADPSAADADDVRAEARAWFTRAAERAASLAASLEAQRALRAAQPSSRPTTLSSAVARSLAPASSRRWADGWTDAESLLERGDRDPRTPRPADAEAAAPRRRSGRCSSTTGPHRGGDRAQLERALALARERRRRGGDRDGLGAARPLPLLRRPHRRRRSRMSSAHSSSASGSG